MDKGKTYHCGYDVESALSKSDAFFEGMLKQGDKTLSPAEARVFFKKLKQHGKEIFTACDHTDEKGYCLGHINHKDGR